MKIDFTSIVIGAHTGYGNASRLLLGALQDRGIEICPDSSVSLNFCMPPDYKFSDATIGYTPWESTEVPNKWIAGLKAADELWTTSSWVAEVFHQFRKDDEVHVIPHGIEDCWKPFQHKREDRPFTFLHVGEPAERKGGDIVLEAWHKAFRHRDDVKLIYKCIKYPIARVKDRSGSIVLSPGMGGNLEVLGQVFTQQELWELYSQVDCLVYPTRGEGFGLIPFEAMGSGLPTILPNQGGTGDFSWLSNMQLKNGMWVGSTAELIHPGLWLDHDVDEVIDLMHWAMLHYDQHSIDSFKSAEYIHTAYSWDSIGKQVEDRLRKYQ